MNTTIDVHTHFIPQSYLDALKEAGVSAKEVGFPLAPWSTQERLELQDKNGIQTEMISLSSPGLRFFKAEDAARLCRGFNEELAKLVTDHPTRFGALATIPLPDIAASLKEIAYAADQLNADGFVLMSNYDGMYPGDPEFSPVLEELNRRKAVIFLHPTETVASKELTFGYPAPMVEYPAETTRAVINLLDNDVISKCPQIRWIVSHGGGTLPLLINRIQEIYPWKQKGKSDQMKQNVQEQIASIFWDLAIVAYDAPLAAIRLSHPAEKLVMGFDLPFYPQDQIAVAKHNLSRFEGFSEEEKMSIDHGTAKALFPRLLSA